MSVGIALQEVQSAEIALAAQLVALAEHHHFESDVYQMGMSRLEVCAEHLCRIRPVLEKLGTRVVEAVAVPGFIDGLRRAVAAPGDRTAPTGLKLLYDLRDTYGTAHRAEITWIMLRQAAKTARDEELLGIADLGASETEQTWKWLRTKVKDATPQVLASQ